MKDAVRIERKLLGSPNHRLTFKFESIQQTIQHTKI